MKKSVFYSVLLGELLLLAGCMMYFYPLLPSTMAIHFGGDGQPNGWQAKESFYGFYALLVLGLSGLFLLLGTIMPKMPVSLINMPNKEYWFAPERAKASFGILTGFFERMTCALVLFLGLIFADTCFSNLQADVHLNSLTFFPLMAVFLGFLFWNVVWLLRQFNLMSSH
ncbi:MAG: DUF1648 domain-containing protein [Candidatus Kapaibacterium sp.]